MARVVAVEMHRNEFNMWREGRGRRLGSGVCGLVGGGLPYWDAQGGSLTWSGHVGLKQLQPQPSMSGLKLMCGKGGHSGEMSVMCGLDDNGYDLSPERPLHFAEKVLPILHGLGTDSYLVVKKHQSMEAMLLYLGRWCTSAGGSCRAGQAEGFLHPEPGPDSARQEQLRQRAAGGQASLEAGQSPSSWEPPVCGQGVGASHAHSSPPPVSHVGDTKHGMMKFREDRSLLGLGLPSGGFHDRYFILNSSCLRLYKEIRVSGPSGSCLVMGPCT